MGIYDAILNGVFSNATAVMRKEAESMMFKVFDNIWQPVLQDIMPRSSAPPLYPGGPTPSINDEFRLTTMVDQQYMAKAADRGE